MDQRHVRVEQLAGNLSREPVLVEMAAQTNHQRRVQHEDKSYVD